MRVLHGYCIAAGIAVFLAGSPVIAAPHHVVSAFLCTDEYVFRLLPRDRIAALSFLSADRHPVVSTIADEVGGIPLVHDSAEEVLSKHPDAVVLAADTQPRLHAQLREAGISVIDVAWPNSLDDVRRTTLALGHALGEDARAQSLLRAMNQALSRTRAQHPPVRALIYESNGYVTAGGVTDDILAHAGLVDVAREIGTTRDGTIPVEAVVASPPELLLLNLTDRRPTLSSLMLRHPALASLASHTLIAHVSLTPLLCPGPWSVAVTPQLAALGQQARALAHAGSRP